MDPEVIPGRFLDFTIEPSRQSMVIATKDIFVPDVDALPMTKSAKCSLQMGDLSRRGFVQSMTASAALLALSENALLAGCRIKPPHRNPQVNDLDVRIKRVLRSEFHYERPRFVAGNSGYRLAGKFRSEPVLIVFADNGQVGMGACDWGANAEKANFLAGKTIGDLLSTHGAEVNERTGTSALWDLAGKCLKKPVYELLGGFRPENGVPVYDGSIYHEELLPRDHNSAYRNPEAKLGRTPNWQDIIKEAVDHSLQLNHKFVKVKIGRGRMHLSRKAGNVQDAAVLKLIREHAGPDFGIGVDANNGYSVADTIWLLNECGDLDIAFIEEMFSDDAKKYQIVQAEIKRLGLKTLTADGESWGRPEDELVGEIIDSGTVDILQADMRQFEFEGIIRESEMAAAAGHGSRIAPHNWGSEFGFYMQVHVACAIPNFYRAEHDPGKPRDDNLAVMGYDIIDGYCRNFDAPGLGIELNSEKLGSLKTDFDIKF